jgi:hypothetical protein
MQLFLICMRQAFTSGSKCYEIITLIAFRHGMFQRFFIRLTCRRFARRLPGMALYAERPQITF